MSLAIAITDEFVIVTSSFGTIKVKKSDPDVLLLLITFLGDYCQILIVERDSAVEMVEFLRESVELLKTFIETFTMITDQRSDGTVIPWSVINTRPECIALINRIPKLIEILTSS